MQLVLGKDVTSFDISGLTVGKEYTFTVKAFDESLNYSEGAEEKVTVADTADYTAPADVTSLTVTNKDASVLLTWIDATDEDIYGYEVTYEATSFLSRLFAMEEDSIMVAPGSEGCYISNLTNGKEYVFTVKSVDTSGNKSAGVTKSITPSIIEKSALQIALEPNITEKTNKDVVITVNATTDSASEIKKIAYVEGTEAKIDTVLVGTDITETKEITATKNTTFTIAAVDTAGRRELAFVTVNNIDKTAPNSVGNFGAGYSNSTNVITLSWTNPSDEDFAGIVITYGKKDSEETTTIELSNDITSYEIENIPDDDSEYTISLKTKDDIENFGEAEIVTLVANKRATISGVTIPNAGEGYTGELPVTIIGENLIGSVITCNDETFTNVTYLSDTKVTATITCNGVVGESAITVTSGISSASGTVKVVAAENCFSVGDILFTDGTKIKAENVQYGVPDSQLDKAFAVIASAPYGGPVGKAVGLRRSSSELQWAPSKTTGYNTNFTGIQADFSSDSSSGYTFSGDIDGSDNWEYICSINPEGTKYPANNYPVFNFALTYGTTAVLTGTDYENGWYVPSIAELYDVYTNKEVVQTSLNAVGGFTLGTSYYWSSSQIASYDEYAYLVRVDDGDVHYGSKSYNYSIVFVLQAFNAEQFNNYEYGTPSITSVTVANAGEGYTGELPVTIIGENLKGYEITCSDSSFGNVNYVSDNMIKATVNCNGIVGENTITVTSGISSASGTVKVLAAEKCFVVGDVLLTDGTRIKAENVQYGVPNRQLSKAFAVITYVSYRGGVGKAVGLQMSSSLLRWAPSGTTGYNTNFTGIQGTRTSGDIDGSDNWEYICSIDPEGTKDAATNYPAFNFALTYGTQAGLTGTEYETGWYVPSVAELYDVYTNKEVVQTSLTKANGFTISSERDYWSSSQSASSINYACDVGFNYGVVDYYSYKDYGSYVFVLQAFNAEQFNNYEYGTPSITSVTVANAGEGYTGKLPVTIIGENLKGHAITSNDASFGYVNYVSDNMIKATVNCNGIVGENTITVTIGISSATGTVKVVAAEKCYSVGDILFTNGIRIKAENVQYGIPDSQLSKAFAVITSVSYGGGVGKAVGLQRSSSELEWAPSGTTGYSTNFTGIQGTTTSGDIDGSDNWEYICSIDPEGTKDPSTNYPAFNFALTYGIQAGLTETDYENGWYVPSVAELYDVYTNKEVVQTSLNAAGGFTLGTSYYWSSSQIASYNYYAYRVDFNDGSVINTNTYKSYNDDVFVLQAFNVEQFNNYEVTPSITSVTVANAGEGYTGKLPVTIIGENLKGHAITCSDSSFGNVNYVSDNMIKATVNCNGIVGENTITVTIGISSATGTVKVVAAEKCYSVGDILFTNGIRIKAENVQYGIPDSQMSKAFAVVTSTVYGGGVGKAVGLQRSSDYLKWAPSGTTGNSTKFTEIQAYFSGDSSSGYTFSGDIDGSDNWKYICSIDPEGTKNPANNYPAFNFALTYGTQAGLTETEYENGWYVPSVAELYDVYTNKEVVQTSLNAVGGFTLGIYSYWSSSQYASTSRNAYEVRFHDGYVYNYSKYNDINVLVLQAFNVEQFNNYEVTPSITSVTINTATVGEGYTGELSVTIIGENLKGHAITSNDASFGNVNYVSDNMIKATVNCNGIVGENTITVTSGTSSASGTVKVVAAENCFSKGDILFTDGTRIKAENVQYGVPDSQLSKAFAVITSVSYRGGVGKAVGLQRLSSTAWAQSGTGYNTKFTNIVCTPSETGSGAALTATFSGDIDGSDNWEYICSIDPEGTKDAATNYPIFNFALTYGTQAGLTETDYENGWYVPSIAELCEVYKNKEVVQTSLNAVGGFTLGTSYYWSSSQNASSDNYAYQVHFSDGSVVSDYSKDSSLYVFVQQAFNAEQFNTYHRSPSITSVTINPATVGEGYTGELSVTIIGENLKGNAITCSDSSFGNVNYVSDNMIKVTVNCNGIVGENTITVTSGTSSASGTVKVVAAEKCFTVGDILFTDGTRIKAENVQYGIPDSQLDKAFAIIASAPYGGGTGKAVGLQRSSGRKWAPSGTTGYYTKFTGIQADYSGSTSSGYTFSGDIDGSDNWEYICSIDPEGTKYPATNYPLFNFANTYGSTAGLTETEYETGWYVPSVAELYDVYTNKEVVQTSLNAAGGFTLETIWYWSSSQSFSRYNSAYKVYFYVDDVYDGGKNFSNSVFVLQAFNAEQFNNYEYGTSITSVTVANAGEGYSGELPVTIIGENLKDYVITCSDSSFGNVNYVSDNMIKATVNCNGIVGENTITVTSGISSASGTVKVVAAEKCYSVGDILFTDGTRIKAEDVQNGVPDSQLSKAFAVIASALYGGVEGKAVGLQRSSTKWAPSGTTGYSTNFTKIQADFSGDSSSGYTFSGDIDGSDNWEYICSIDPEGTKDPANNYPAFNFALTYGATAGLTETDYENGWYVPSVAELYDVYTNKEVV